MKLKIRADKDDLMIFAVFALFLLYIVAIGIVNLHSFATEGYFSGLNPLPAFTPKFLWMTLLIYFAALIGMLVSVKSYFFEFEKGVGITTEKKDKGYSRWAKEKEIKAEEDIAMVNPEQEYSSVAGVPLILKDHEAWVDNGEYHTLVIGSTGSGKTQTVIKPTVKLLAKAGESMIITDPKGEIYEATANMLKEKGYDVQILNFRDPQNGSSWNPLSLPYRMYKSGNQDKAIELLDDLALNILYDESSNNSDPFWEKTSADYFSGVALGLFEDAKEDEININSISLMTTVGEEKFGGSTYIKEYFSFKDPASASVINASSTINAPTDTKGSILSVFRQKIKLFASRENLSEMLSHNDIELADIGRRKTALFIVVQDEKKTYHSLVTILLKQCYETLIAVAQENGGELPVRTNFLLDEFANMPPLKDVTTMITAARSRHIRFTMIIQNYAQLNQVYGKENAETIRGNCGNIIYLISAELAALEEISKMCGEVKSKDDEKTASTPLVTVSDLQRMKQFEVIILRMRMQPFKTKFTPDFQLNWGKTYPKASYPEREKLPVHTFDIKTFVKEKKKEKLLDMMNSNNANPNGGSTPPGFVPPNLFGIGAGSNSNANANGNPMGGPMPNLSGMPRPNMQPNSNPMPAFMNPSMENAGNASSKPSFDVDELVKKIDAKIAELEKEEAMNKQKQQQKLEAMKAKEAKPVKDVSPVKEVVNSPIPDVKPVVKEQPKKEVNLSLDDDDDDDFFDDFFDE